MHIRRYARRNHLCKFWFGKIKGFGIYGGSNFGFSLVTLTTVLRYRTACDFGQKEAASVAVVTNLRLLYFIAVAVETNKKVIVPQAFVVVTCELKVSALSGNRQNT